MAINPNIPLTVQPGPNIPGVFQAAQNFQKGEKRNKLLDLALQDAQTQQPFAQRNAEIAQESAEIDLSTAEAQQRLRNDYIQATEARRLLSLGDTEGATQVLTADGPEDRVGQSLAQRLQAGDTEGVGEILGQLKDELQQNLAGLGGSGTSRVQSSFVGENGNMWIIDRRTGKPEDTGVKASETMKLVTFADGSKGLVDVQGGDAGRPPAIVESTEQALSGAQSAARATETGTQQAQLAAIAPKEAEKGSAGRVQEDISLARDAVGGIPILKRGIDLLDRIQTGGVNAIALNVKRTLGIEGADEGELSNSLSKAVLSQLRQTFGAQFTEREGKLLLDIEAGFDKSPANNKRLLKRALIVAESAVERGMKAARRAGDIDALEDLQERMEFDLTSELEGGQSIQEGATATNPQTGERVIFRNGQWVPTNG